MTTRIRKRPILQEDIGFDSTGANQTSTFVASDGTQKEGHLINAGHIPILANLQTILNAGNVNAALMALYNTYKASGGAATELAAGILKIASAKEVKAGTDNAKAVTPAGLAALVASTTLAGLVKLATSDDLTQKTNLSSVVTVGLIDKLLWPAGSIRMWNLETLPVGWLECKGQLLNRENFSDLWDAVKAEAIDDSTWAGGQYGKYSKGDGATTFRLPDYRGTFPRFADHGRGLDPDASSRVGGDIAGSVQNSAVEAHTHNIATAISQGECYGSKIGSAPGNPPLVNIATASDGGSETRPVNAAFILIVKY